MNFELGKTYIVDVNEKGIIPLMEFDRSKWYDKDHEDLDFLTDDEKIVIINCVLDKIRAEIFNACSDSYHMPVYKLSCEEIFEIIDKYKAESEDNG